MGEATKTCIAVATLDNPAAEPFAVILVDPDVRIDGGVKATVVSVHWTEDEANKAAGLPTPRSAGR